MGRTYTVQDRLNHHMRLTEILERGNEELMKMNQLLEVRNQWLEGMHEQQAELIAKQNQIIALLQQPPQPQQAPSETVNQEVRGCCQLPPPGTAAAAA